MRLIRLLVINLALTFLSVLPGIILAILISHVVGFFFYSEAYRYDINGGSIDSRKLERFNHMRSVAAAGAFIACLLSAQIVFLVHHLSRTPRGA